MAIRMKKLTVYVNDKRFGAHLSASIAARAPDIGASCARHESTLIADIGGRSALPQKAARRQL
jgi:hypothetical protein